MGLKNACRKNPSLMRRFSISEFIEDSSIL
jgi:hypothetical protein